MFFVISVAFSSLTLVVCDRYDPFFYAGYNMPSYLGYGYFNTLLGTRLANVIYRNANVGAPVEGGLVSAFYVRQA